MNKESAPKEVVDFINEKIEQGYTLGQVAEYFYHIMEFESTWSNFPYIVKWGRLNFTLFAELWIDRLKEEAHDTTIRNKRSLSSDCDNQED